MQSWEVLAESLAETNEIFGLANLAMAAAVVALGEQSGGERIIPSVDNNSAAGALNRAPSRIQAILVSIESSWMRSASVGIMLGSARSFRGESSVNSQ